MNRRQFVTLAGAGLASLSIAAGTKSKATGFFRVEQAGGRWWFITPEGRRFFSLGLNHVDSSPLRYPEAGETWSHKYRNSSERWLKDAVRRDLDDWGFNSLGWNQEVVVRGDLIHRHSPSFTFEEYQWLGLPYCHLLPFAETHQWENETRHPDFFSKDFEEWCDYVARSQCARFAADPKLIGYFYTDCPMWVHTRPANKWKGSIFEPQKLAKDAGRDELRRLAARYYQVTHAAIRRYDPHHLILGDRYEANAPLPMEVIESAKPFVDVLSFQDFKDPIVHLAEWHARTGKPVLWADGAKNVPAKDAGSGASYIRNDGRWYAEVLKSLRSNPGCVGVHLCGAYLRNHARNRGLRDARERPDAENLALITQANRETSRWVSQYRS
jgi:hypothetical protein